jgi:hypothetical protein
VEISPPPLPLSKIPLVSSGGRGRVWVEVTVSYPLIIEHIHLWYKKSPSEILHLGLVKLLVSWRFTFS